MLVLAPLLLAAAGSVPGGPSFPLNAFPAQPANAMAFPLDALFTDIPQGEQRAVAVVVRPPANHDWQPAAHDVGAAIVPAVQDHPKVRSVVVLEDPDAVRNNSDMALAQGAAQNGMDLLLVARITDPEQDLGYPDVTLTILDGMGVELRSVTRNYSVLWQQPLQTRRADAEPTPAAPVEEDRGWGTDARILGVGLGAGLISGAAGLVAFGIGAALLWLATPVQVYLKSNPDMAAAAANALSYPGIGLMLVQPCFISGCLGFPLLGAAIVFIRRDRGRSIGPCLAAVLPCLMQGCLTLLCDGLCSFGNKRASSDDAPPAEDSVDEEDAPRTPRVSQPATGDNGHRTAPSRGESVIGEKKRKKGEQEEQREAPGPVRRPQRDVGR